MLMHFIALESLFWSLLPLLTNVHIWTNLAASKALCAATRAWFSSCPSSLNSCRTKHHAVLRTCVAISHMSHMSHRHRQYCRFMIYKWTCFLEASDVDPALCVESVRGSLSFCLNFSIHLERVTKAWPWEHAIESSHVTENFSEHCSC